MSDEVHPDPVQDLWRVGECHLLLDDVVVDQAESATAPLDRPVHADQVRVGERALPGPKELDLVVERLRHRLTNAVLVHPRTHLLSEQFLCIGESEIHDHGVPPRWPRGRHVWIQSL